MDRVASSSGEDNPHRPGQQEQRTRELGPSGMTSGRNLCSVLLHEEHTQGDPRKAWKRSFGKWGG